MMPRPPRSNLTDPLFPYTPLFRSRRPAISGSTLPRPHRLSTPMEMLCTQRRAIVLFNESDSQLSLSVDAPPSRGIEASDWSAWRPDCRHLREPKAHDRTEEQTSELQSLMRNSYAVFCLKKNK